MRIRSSSSTARRSSGCSAAEEARFGETLERGMKLFEEAAAGGQITGDDAFTLQATYGFPIELTQELARERGLEVNDEEYTRLMEEHREISRAGVAGGSAQRAAEFSNAPASGREFVGYEKTEVLTQIGALEELGGRALPRRSSRESPFYPAGGGQVTDTGLHREGRRVAARPCARRIGSSTTRCCSSRARASPRATASRRSSPWNVRFPTQANHTGTHVLHQCLREVLGDHVKQAGSAVRPDKLRFDFTHPQALTADERDGGRAPRQRAHLREPARAHLRDADRRGAQARRDDALRREVRRDRARRRHRRLVDRAVRRHARPLDGGDRAVRDPHRELRRRGRAAHRGGHRRRGVRVSARAGARGRRAPRRARAARARSRRSRSGESSADFEIVGTRGRRRCSSRRRP